SPWRGHMPLEMLGRSRFPAIGDAPFVVTLAPYGFFWFKLDDESAVGEPRSIVPELPTLVLGAGVQSLLEGRTREILEREVLPAFLSTARWFGDKGGRRLEVQVAAAMPLLDGNPGAMLTLLDVTTD